MQNKQNERYEKNSKRLRSFSVNQPVMFRHYGSSTEPWVKGVVTQKLGNLHYEIESGGSTHKRHVDQLNEYIPRIPNHEVTSENLKSSNNATKTMLTP